MHVEWNPIGTLLILNKNESIKDTFIRTAENYSKMLNYLTTYTIFR